MKNFRDADEYYYSSDYLSSTVPQDYFYLKGLQERKIYINCLIDADLTERAIIPLKRMIEEDSEAPIYIYLNTTGGCVSDGFALITEIERSPAPITIEVGGMAASMGLLITMAGHNNPKVRAVCNKYTVGLLHSGSTVVSGTTDGVQDTSKFNERYENEVIKEFIVTHSNITSDKYDQIYRHQFWMTAGDMLEYGIVDEIL